MVERLDLLGIAKVVADLRLDLMLGDRLAELRGTRAVDRSRWTRQCPPDPARVPIDPALGHRIGLGARRVRRRNAEQLEAAHGPQPFGKLAIVEPAAVPFLALA